MDENELLLLGILIVQSQHGYQINEFIDKNLSRLTTMKRPTAYATLDRLHRQGYVAVQAEQAGNRPPRKVYSITPAGERYFRDLLRANLSTAHLTSTTEVGLLFLANLPPREAEACLARRLTQLNDLIATHEGVPAHGQGRGVDWAMEHFLVLLQAERDWLATVLHRLAHDAPQPMA